MKRSIKAYLALALVLLMSLSALTACNETDDITSEQTTVAQTDPITGSDELSADFDYENADISDLITLDKAEYDSMTVTLPTGYVYTDEILEEQLTKELFKRKTQTNGDTQVTDQPIKLGDSAFIYYTGYLDGVPFTGGSNAEDPSPSELSIGSGTFIPGFEEGLIGVIPSSTSKDSPYDLYVTFPEDYHSAEMAGKSVVFKVWIEYVVQYTIPTLTDEYVRSEFEYEGSADEYKADLGKALKEKMEAQAREQALVGAINMLIEAADIHEYPESSVSYWYNMYISEFNYYMQYYNMYGYDFTSLDQFVPMYLGLGEGEDWQAVTASYAKETVANLLVHYAIADSLGISVTDEEYANELAAIAESYSTDEKTVTPEEIEEQYGKQAVRQSVLLEKVEEHLSSVITIEYKD